MFLYSCLLYASIPKLSKSINTYKNLLYDPIFRIRLHMKKTANNRYSIMVAIAKTYMFDLTVKYKHTLNAKSGR